ncbi:MAG TPA: hypothetical protein VLV89_05310 [Candidatus Acidoferrum sp.]|nr:hypothetical protein [Candidatus Acidoferrum sp.]
MFPIGTDPQPRLIDFAILAANNRCMAKPQVAHRIKSYSAATGYVYQYCFVEVRPARRGFSAGTEYIYVVSVDRQENFPVAVFVRKSAVEKWSQRESRMVSGTEEYAIAKMRLFQAFDEIENVATAHPDLQVDDSNLSSLMEKLDL